MIRDLGLEPVQNAEQNEALALAASAFEQFAPAIKMISSELSEAIASAPSFDLIESKIADLSLEVTAAIEEPLAIAIFNIHLLGRAQIYLDQQRQRERGSQGRLGAIALDTEFEPLPFDEAIDFFRRKTALSAEQFARLSDQARQKAFSVAAAASRQARLSVRGLIDQALAEGMTLRDFQEQAANILGRLGLSERAPWYWETVYRTNLASSYQVGRWKQITDPAVADEFPYLRYVSALLPTSRPSHREKHGLVYPVGDPFWDEWYPPNGFNCYCTVMQVSQSLLDRRGWRVSRDRSFAFPTADEGFRVNAGKADAV